MRFVLCIASLAAVGSAVLGNAQPAKTDLAALDCNALDSRLVLAERNNAGVQDYPRGFYGPKVGLHGSAGPRRGDRWFWVDTYPLPPAIQQELDLLGAMERKKCKQVMWPRSTQPQQLDVTLRYRDQPSGSLEEQSHHIALVKRARLILNGSGTGKVADGAGGASGNFEFTFRAEGPSADAMFYALEKTLREYRALKVVRIVKRYGNLSRRVEEETIQWK